MKTVKLGLFAIWVLAWPTAYAGTGYDCGSPQNPCPTAPPSTGSAPAPTYNGGSGGGNGQAVVNAGMAAAAAWLQKNQEESDALQKQLDDAVQQQNAAAAREREQRDAEAGAAARKRREEAQAQEAARQKAMVDNDPGLNPFGPPAGGSKSGAGSTTKTATKPLDPSLDYEGKGCSFFTRPGDEAHANTYADNTTVAYGQRVYRCEYGRWKYLYPASVLNAKDLADIDAAKREKVLVPTNLFEDE